MHKLKCKNKQQIPQCIVTSIVTYSLDEKKWHLFAQRAYCEPSCPAHHQEVIMFVEDLIACKALRKATGTDSKKNLFDTYMKY